MCTPPPRSARLAYMPALCTSPDRARLVAELTTWNPGIAELLMDLEADDDLRAKLEIELLDGASGGEAS
jgi:hypothetical protein